ncbi:hypothetical protein B0T25DRAFT_443552, partial [Lasiosphaeria hispida]
INYLVRASQTKLRLIQGDSEAFADVLTLMNDYEGVLSRHESLAANLGAKLTAPRLLRAMEILFEGAITVSPTLSPQSPFRDSRPSTWYTPSWLEIVSFAKSNPTEFNLTSTPDGRRVCRFLMKNVHVEISEDDWRLVMSGVLDRFPLASQPLEEDETAELATLDILEQRVQTLIKKADEVARKARQLNYHLSGRKAAITSRRSTPHPQTTAGFQAAMTQPPAARPTYDLHADLLQQFLTTPTAPIPSQPPSSLPTPSEPPRLRPPPTAAPSQSTRPSPAPPGPAPSDSPTPTRPDPGAPSDDPSALHRPLIQARIEKLARGDAITPPCDRCRRLKTACIKHLTACQGCTRKHAKCSWKGITAEEITALHKDTPPRPSTTAPASEGEEGARVLREVSGRLRMPSTSTSTSSAIPGGGGFDLARILFPDRDARRRDEDRDEMEVDEAESAKGKEPSSSASGYPYQQHSLLSHMASVATAAAEARERRGTTSRASSLGRD